ncbi:hypothetical protein KPL48_04430 [Clostridium estertheticum]|nr:hypothetical protein [Clostridium estertheticum]
MLIGGRSDISFGGDELLTPYRIIFAGKGAKTYARKLISLDEILFDAAKDVLNGALIGFDAVAVNFNILQIYILKLFYYVIF